MFFALTLPPMIVWLGAGVVAVAATPFIWWLILKSREDQVLVGRARVRVARPVQTASATEGAAGVRRPARLLLASARAHLPGVIAWGRERLDPADPRGLPLTLAVGGAVVAIWVFGGLTQDVLGHDDTVLADPRVEGLVVAHRVGWLTGAVRILTWLGSTAVLVPAVVLIGGVLLLRRRDWRPLAALAVALGGAVGLYDIVKPAVGRARPPAALWIRPYSGAAFPSGHATQSVASYEMPALIPSAGTSCGRRALVWSGAAMVALVVGASRVYLGAHWMTDVLGGYALGVAWVALLVAIGLLLRSPTPSEAGEQGAFGALSPVDRQRRRPEVA